MGGLINKLQFNYRKLPLPVRTSVIYTMCSVLQQGISFIAVPIYTRMMPSEQYGIYSLYHSWNQILIIFATLNMWNYLFNNGMIKYEKRKNEFTSALLGLNIALTTGLLLIALVISDWFSAVSGLPLIVMWMMLVDFYLKPGFEYWSARQRFEFDIKKFTIASIVIAFSTPLVSISLLLLFKRFGFGNPGTALVMGKVLCAGVIYLVVNEHLIRRCRKIYDKEIWCFALRFNLPLIPHFLSMVLLAQSDRIMIGAMCGKSEAAICGIAHSVAGVLLIINSAVMNSLIPWTYRKLRDRDYVKLSYVSAFSLALIAILNLMASVCAPEIIGIMAPKEYQAAIYIIPPIAISNVFMFMFNLYANIEYYHEKTKMVAIASCISAFANIVLNYIFISKYGFLAAGYTTLVCYIIYAFCHYCFMKRILREQKVTERIYDNRLLWSIAIIAAFVSMFVVLLYPYRLFRWGLLLISLALAVVYRNKIIRMAADIFSS